MFVLLPLIPLLLYVAKTLQNYQETLKETELAIHWFEENYIKLNAGICHLHISGHKYEYQWVKIDKNMVW